MFHAIANIRFAVRPPDGSAFSLAKIFAGAMLAIAAAVLPLPALAVIDDSQKAESCVSITDTGDGAIYANLCGRTINVVYCWAARSAERGGRCTPGTRATLAADHSINIAVASLVVSGECFSPFWPVNIRVDYNAQRVDFDCDDAPQTGNDGSESGGGGSGGSGGGGSNSGLAIGLGAAALIGIGVYVLNSDDEESAFTLQPSAFYENRNGSETLRYGMRLAYDQDPWRLWWSADDARFGWGGEWSGDWLRAQAEVWESAGSLDLRAGLGMEWARAGWTIRPSVRAGDLRRPAEADFHLGLGRAF